MYGGGKSGCEDVFGFELKLPSKGEPKRKWNKVYECTFARAAGGGAAATKKSKTTKKSEVVSAAADVKQVSTAKKKKGSTKTAGAGAGAGAGARAARTGTGATAGTAAAKPGKRKATAPPEKTTAAPLKRRDSAGEAAAAGVGRAGKASIDQEAHAQMIQKLKFKRNLDKLQEGLHNLEESGMREAEAVVKRYAQDGEWTYRACSPAEPAHRMITFDLYSMNHACLDALNLLIAEPRTAS